jgi:hypothetical protein
MFPCFGLRKESLQSLRLQCLRRRLWLFLSFECGKKV